MIKEVTGDIVLSKAGRDVRRDGVIARKDSCRIQRPGS